MTDRTSFLQRFSRGERLVHRFTAILMLTCLVTGLVLYEGMFSSIVGHRHLIETVHVWCGFALPAPMLFGLVSVAYRADLRRLNRFSPADLRWLRPRRPVAERAKLPVGKFNAGQKLNSALSAGSILVLLGTGVLMYFTGLVQLSWRTGATFVHDWAAIAVGLLVIGHIYRAMNDPQARHGMRTGEVPRAWAEQHHGHWAAEVDSEIDQ